MRTTYYDVYKVWAATKTLVLVASGFDTEAEAKKYAQGAKEADLRNGDSAGEYEVKPRTTGRLFG